MKLGEKPDGRKYSRVLRRSVTIIDHIDKNRIFELKEVAIEINKSKSEKFEEFYNLKTEKQMSVSRIKDYIRYLEHLKAIVKVENQNDKYKLYFEKPVNNNMWIQILADMALEHMCELLDIDISKIIVKLKNIIKDHFKNKQIPTVDSIIKTLDIGTRKSEELFRWSLYVFLDSPICPFDLKRNPFLTIKD